MLIFAGINFVDGYVTSCCVIMGCFQGNLTTAFLGLVQVGADEEYLPTEIATDYIEYGIG